MGKTDVPKFTAPEKIPANSATVSKMLQKHGHATASRLVKLTNRPIKSVLSTLRTLHDRSKIHVGAYERNKRGQVAKVWYWGDGDDVREPSTIEHKNGFIPRPDEAAAWLRNPI
jgi:hypothetical protein